MHAREATHAHDPFTLDPDPGRRLALRGLGGLAATWALTACGGGSSGEAEAADSGSTGSSTSSSSSSSTTTTTSSCLRIPEETAGPYPGDGSNAVNGSVVNALALSGILRSDIRSSVAGASGTAAGVPLTVRLRLLNVGGSCASLAGYAIYLWHADAQGRYSMYSTGVTGENYLRGVQVSGNDGVATFVTVFPGCYVGRWPHIHFEVYRSATPATASSNKLRTSQLALPADVCAAVYASGATYAGSAANLAGVSLAGDNVFSDGVSSQLASVSGSVAEGFVATLDVGIDA